MKRLFNLDLVAATLLVAGIVLILAILPDINKPFNILSQALSDIDITDINYSKVKMNIQPDTNIFIINAGDAKRGEMASHIKKILKFNPKVLGVDFYFTKEKSPKDDSLLNDVVSKSTNVVMASFFRDTSLNSPSLLNPDTLITSLKKFGTKNNCFGYVNLQSDKSYRTIRTFQPSIKYKDSTYLSFAAMVTGMFDSLALKRLFDRQNDIETISFNGNINKFQVIDVRELETDSTILENIRGKIVLYGFLGRSIFDSTNCEDKFFTPFNEYYIGRTFPDMYGIVIHANIIATILEGDYIHTPGVVNILIILFILIYLNIALFEYIKVKIPWLYGGEMKILVLIELVILLYIAVWLFAKFAIKLNIAMLLVSLLIAPDISEIYFSSVKNYFSLLYKRFKK